MWFCFAFLWWLAMLSIFSFVYWPPVCLLWENVSLGLQCIFQSDFFLYWLVWIVYIYIGYQPLISHIIWEYCFPFSRLSFCFVSGFLCCAKALSLIKFPFVYFCFNFLCLRSKKNIGSDLCPSILCMFSFKSFMVSGLTLGL